MKTATLTIPKLYKLKDVAEIIGKTPEHLRRCIRAAMDEQYRKKRKLNLFTIRKMPVLDWYQCGGEWVIEEGDLAKQLRRKA